jgi:hypothetical protein
MKPEAPLIIEGSSGFGTAGGGISSAPTTSTTSPAPPQ